MAGRPTPDPKILLGLWLYATVEGVGSARALARRCGHHAAYRWMCGRVPVNDHGLSDFRVAAGAGLARILSESVAALMAEGLVSLEEVAVDGTRIAANAGKGSLGDASRIARAESQTASRARAARDRLAARQAEKAGRETTHKTQEAAKGPPKVSATDPASAADEDARRQLPPGLQPDRGGGAATAGHPGHRTL